MPPPKKKKNLNQADYVKHVGYKDILCEFDQESFFLPMYILKILLHVT